MYLELIVGDVRALVDIDQSGPPRCRGLFRGIASPAILCHKEPARESKAPYLGLWNAKYSALEGILLAPRWFFMA